MVQPLSFFNSDKLNDVVLVARLRDILERLPGHRDREASKQVTRGESATKGELYRLL